MVPVFCLFIGGDTGPCLVLLPLAAPPSSSAGANNNYINQFTCDSSNEHKVKNFKDAS